MANECWEGARVYPIGWEPKTSCSAVPQCEEADQTTSVACNASACYMIPGVGDYVEEETPTYCAVRV